MSQAPGIPGAVLAEHLERPGPMRGRAFSGALWVSADRQGSALAAGPRGCAACLQMGYKRREGAANLLHGSIPGTLRPLAVYSIVCAR